jgi:hypothetical protein
MNWGSSYLVNDLYRRFLRKDASEQHYVLISRLATFVTLVLSIIVTVFMNQISKVWELLLTLGAGTGLVYILRWYWWRVNAWSEVSAMASALVTSVLLRQVFDPATPRGFALNLILTTAVTTVVWLAVTFATRPEADATLDAFYRKVRPAGSGWEPVAKRTGIAPPPGEIARNFSLWILGIAFVYSIMFAAGGVIFHLQRQALVFGAILVVSGPLLVAGLVRDRA